jgi:hypothetical protein
MSSWVEYFQNSFMTSLWLVPFLSVNRNTEAHLEDSQKFVKQKKFLKRMCWYWTTTNMVSSNIPYSLRFNHSNESITKITRIMQQLIGSPVYCQCAVHLNCRQSMLMFQCQSWHQCTLTNIRVIGGTLNTIEKVSVVSCNINKHKLPDKDA